MRGARSLREPVFKVAGGAAAICLLLWSLVPAMDPTVSTRRLLWAMFSYPNFYDYFLRWYLWGWPILTIVSTIGALQLITRFMANRARPALLFIPGAILIPALIGSFFQPSDDAVRYTIHLYPAMVILFAVVTCEIIGYCHWRFSYGRLRRGVIATAVMLARVFIRPIRWQRGLLAIGATELPGIRSEISEVGILSQDTMRIIRRRASMSESISPRLTE